ncbi:transcription factor bHLH18-like [Coffea eugenioides]|uniref:transcription factor bHLH18-like n=1 Tax=Coffea eugenioides TaxID=49369 RepID=UPI000F60B015|nr:transcription factor bHLH18-like [Coffea eugenioides]
MEDTAEASWFSELEGMEDPFVSDQYDITDFFDEELSAALGEEQYFPSSLSPQCNSLSSGQIPRNNSTTSLCGSSTMEPPQNVVERPSKHHKANNYLNNSSTLQATNSCHEHVICTFGNSNVVPERNRQQLIMGTNTGDDLVSEALISRASFTSLVEAVKGVHTTKKTSGRTRPPSQTYDHIIAERKRREQLSQQFVALSAIVPGLKKMDKTSVLGDTIKYLKHLQQREKELEEQATVQTMESLVLVKKSQLLLEDEGEPSDEQGGCCNEQPLPEIEAKMCDKHVLVRILCEKHRGVLVEILSEMDKLNLDVINTNVAPFGSLALYITIITEMKREFNLSMKELVNSLASGLRRATLQKA